MRVCCQKTLCFLRVETLAGMFFIALICLFSVLTKVRLCYFYVLLFFVDLGILD